eukprot:scaffold9747_cov30-Attheya_sp.AAC.1
MNRLGYISYMADDDRTTSLVMTLGHSAYSLLYYSPMLRAQPKDGVSAPARTAYCVVCGVWCAANDDSIPSMMDSCVSLLSLSGLLSLVRV